MDENDIIIKMSTAGGYMKFLFAPDSFKGTMSAININRLLRHATHRVLGSVEYIDVTMAMVEKEQWKLSLVICVVQLCMYQHTIHT